MSLEPGQMIEGKYRIVKMIGEGGMGAVYLGENVRINRKVAIKVLHAAYTGNEEVMQRFEREAQAAGRIGNDHILEVLDLGQLGDGDHFIIMEFLDGEPLSTRIKNRERLMPAEATPIIRQVLEGLGAAHAAGIIHRDLKPDNIFILREKAGVHDYVKIIDFGISKFNQLSGDGMKMTRTGAVMGTPYYMSPEQASGSAEADQRSDIYSVGVILYEAVTGRVPFDAGTFNQLMFKIVLSEVPPPETIVPDLDPGFSSIIAKSMARDLTQRFQTTADFIRALDAWLRTGASVSVPPAADAAAMGLVPTSGAGARTAMGSQTNINRGTATPGPGTGGNWASSQPDVAPTGLPKKSSAGVLAGLAAVAILVVVGVAFGAYSMLDKKGEPEAASSAAAPSSSPAAAALRGDGSPSDTDADAKPEVSATPPAPAAATPPAASSAPSIAAPAAPAARPAASKPGPRPAPAKPGAKPAAAPGAKPGGAAPDFGY
ncbi:MAG TPA: serine/threonine-protein kinase [Polyangiaceae bacterium]|nr:serine/threonine-protein kinase [Polyangiaceae bacterium]